MDFPEKYHRLRASLQFRERIMGGIPRTGDISTIEAWLKAQGLDLAAIAEVAEATAEEMEEQAAEQPTTGFKRTDDGFLCIEARCTGALLKEVATTSGLTTHFRNPSLKQTLQHAIAIRPHRIPLGMVEPSGTQLSFVHTWRGSSIKRADYVDQPLIKFEVWVIKTNISAIMPWGHKVRPERFIGKRLPGFGVWDQLVWHLLILGQEVGLGAWRTQYEGKYDVLTFERLNEDLEDWEEIWHSEEATKT